MAVTLLGFGIAGAILRPRHVPIWLFPLVAVAGALVAGIVSVPEAVAGAEPLVEPVAFVLLMVPFAALLDEAAVFDNLARVAATRRRPEWSLWLLAAGTVALLNLDTAVILLTPLYVRTARRLGISPLPLAFQPLLAAFVASSLLPISNLTNLIAANRFGLSAVDVMTHLGLPVVAATAVGWVAWRHAFASETAVRGVTTAGQPPDRDALLLGAWAVSALVGGVLAGEQVGVAPWVVATIVVTVLAVRRRRLPWRSMPLGVAAVALCLAALAPRALTSLGSFAVADHQSPGGVIAVAAVSGTVANAANNLPTLVAGLHAVHGTGSALWALLLGVNAGPVLLGVGSLASLLWIDLARRDGLEVPARRFAALGLRVGLPAFTTAVALLAAQVAIVGR